MSIQLHVWLHIKCSLLLSNENLFKSSQVTESRQVWQRWQVHIHGITWLTCMESICLSARFIYKNSALCGDHTWLNCCIMWRLHLSACLISEYSALNVSHGDYICLLACFISETRQWTLGNHCKREWHLGADQWKMVINFTFDTVTSPPVRRHKWPTILSCQVHIWYSVTLI